MNKNLSSPFSTGGGGYHYEAHVQASFVVLMLTGGCVPFLPCWPISEILTQGKIAGFDTDDVIVTVKNSGTGEQRKMLAQVKHSIAVTNSDNDFGKFIQAAWNDFNNPEVFSKKKDVITLITGSLSGVDNHNVQWLLTQAKRTKNVGDFFRNVKQAYFSPPKSQEKLEVISRHLKAANSGIVVSDNDLYDFLNHFHILVYDLGEEDGSILSLLFSHISYSRQLEPRLLWSRVVDFVQSWNQAAGTVTLENLPEDLKGAFKQKEKPAATIPDELKAVQESEEADWASHPDATYLAHLNFVGSWDENNKDDIKAIKQLIDIEYDDWIGKAREILQHPDSPLVVHNGVWTISNRTELWRSLGPRILDQSLETFKTLAISVLSERDPALGLPAGERYAANIHGKVFNYSHSIRKGVAEGLAILGNNSEVCSHCSQGKAVETADLVIRTVFNDGDWTLWRSLNRLLPALAEASPVQFMTAVEDALRKSPCPFKQIFEEEGTTANIITSDNYMTGLLWALEGLAWDENYTVRVCVILAELASHDSGGQWANRPSGSLATILLPWLPQTVASIEKRQAAVKTVIQEYPDIGWELLLQLLPNQRQFSDHTYKPEWRNPIPNDFEIKVSKHEYWQQVSFYSDLAVETADHNINQLSELIDNVSNLTIPAVDQLIDVLSSSFISDLREEQKMLIWNRLTKITRRHRRFADAKWALSDEILTKIEEVGGRLAPSNPFYRNQFLFSEGDFDLYDEKDNYEEQREKLNEQRDTAIEEIFQLGGVDSVIQFSESIPSSHRVGHALGSISAPEIEQALLPDYLDSDDNDDSEFVNAYIWRRRYISGWGWCDGIDKSEWSTKQIGCLLASLPFTKEAWDRAEQWLGKHQAEYWTRARASAHFYDAEDDIDIAIEQLIKHDRPHTVINLLAPMLSVEKPFRIDQCVQALLAAPTSSEPVLDMEREHIVELIKHIQSEPSVLQDDLIKIEWVYLPLLDDYIGARPKLLQEMLTNDPEFFCEVIRLIYRSEKEGESQEKPTEEAKANASKAWNLLHDWKMPPGTQEDGSFNADAFIEWLRKVKDISSESGHLDVSLIQVGEVLAYSPADPDGLWIHKTIAAAMNSRDVDQMRRGYRTGLYNKRGAHFIDPAGTPEKELAQQFHEQAEEVENAGFQRLAATLKDLSGEYNMDAERIISDHKNRNNLCDS